MSEHEKHKIEYGILAILLAIFFVLFVNFRYDKGMLKILSGFVSVTYILWGVVHHMLEGRLSRLIALEYIMYGTFVFLLLMIALSY